MLSRNSRQCNCDAGETTAYTYDGTNQLVSSETDGILTTRYRYDAAGRLVEEGGKSYRYGWLDKVVSVSEEGQVTATFGYHAGGQLAAATHGDKTESFLWDGLALIRRDGTEYVNEPHAGGGAPVLAGDRVLFNDMLGSTLGIKDPNGFNTVQRTAFGETGGNSAEEFFTGKPMVGELGYAFLFRNYRPEHGKWQTADLMGYPDGWNNLAYVNNGVTSAIDLFGAVTISSFKDALDHYAWGGGVDATIASSVILQSTSTAGYAEQLLAVEALLAAQPFDVNSGHLSYSGDFFWDQGLILGGNTMNFYTSFDWTASSWAWDPYTGRFYRTLTGIGDILLYTEDDWDFEWHENASVWWNLVHEWGPSVAADFYSFFWGNPGQTGDAFHLSGAALIQDHMFWATQYKYE